MRPLSVYIVVSYRCGVGSSVPGGASTKSLLIDSALEASSSDADSMGAPKVCRNSSGETLVSRSAMAFFSASERRLISMYGPAIAAMEENSSMRPWMAPTNFVPYRSASYAGKMAYTPPIMLTARAVLAQKPYTGRAEPVLTTLSTRFGRNRYSGIEPRVKSMNVFLRPNASLTAAQPNRPPRFPAESMSRKFAAKAEVTSSGTNEEKTSLIMGLATLNRPMPPVARQKKLVPSR
mmetsp:Transcript_39127/g.80134  ORF Transcript_39127/g.80134 Transcript_39127/m.80134 type:complete len:235 (+) Transcript_39127:295-999(+)